VVAKPDRQRFVDLGRSTVPVGRMSAFGSYPHPYVVQLSVSGSRPYLALSIGTGHLSSGRVFTLDEVLRPSGDVAATWREHFEHAGAAWALPHLRELMKGGRVAEEQLIAGYRRQHGSDPDVEFLPVPGEP
jgi:hypothetical protein